MNGNGPSGAGHQLVEWVITDTVVAGVAAHAAAGVPGVVRLEPGLVGLVGSLARSARRRWNGADTAPTDGVRAEVIDGTAWIEVDVATSGQDQAAAVGQAVQRAVTKAVTAATGLPVAEVCVSILDIELGVAAR